MNENGFGFCGDRGARPVVAEVARREDICTASSINGAERRGGRRARRQRIFAGDHRTPPRPSATLPPSNGSDSALSSELKGVRVRIGADAPSR